jgi:putative aldouronate transport system permease protein
MKLNKKIKINFTQIMLHSFFILLAIICIAPVILVVMVSVTDDRSLMINGFTFFPKKFSLEAYKYIFYDAKSLVNSYFVTICITIAGTILSLLITSLYAYPISRQDLPHKKFFVFIVFFVMLFNGGLVSSYIINTKILHFNNNVIALLVPFLITPFNVLIMKTFFSNTIPSSLIEAAQLDGASELKVYRSIILPLSKPVLATVGLFNTLGYWNDWFSSLLYISNKNLYTIQFVMYKSLMNIEFLKNNIAAGAGGNLAVEVMKAPSQGIRFAMVVVGVGPMLLAYPFFQRYFIEGLTVGSIKG